LAKIEYKNPLSPPPFLFFSTPHWLATTVKGCASDIIPLDSNTRQQPSATSTSTACWTHQQPSTTNPLDINNIDNPFGQQPLWGDNQLFGRQPAGRQPPLDTNNIDNPLGRQQQQ
jgi:hypothetical protein